MHNRNDKLLDRPVVETMGRQYEEAYCASEPEKRGGVCCILDDLLYSGIARAEVCLLAPVHSLQMASEGQPLKMLNIALPRYP